MEEISGVKFTQAQVALAAQYVYGDKLTTQKEIILVAPEEESLVPAAKPEKQVNEKVPIPQNKDEARQLVKTFESGARNLRSDEPVADSVAQHMLSDKTSLLEEQWLGTEEEELYAYVSLALFACSLLISEPDMFLSCSTSTRR